MESLNGFTIDEIKTELSNELGYDTTQIRLFGSRINGGWKVNSDLDVAIKDEMRTEEDIINKVCLTLNCEIRFVEDFEISWLANSV